MKLTAKEREALAMLRELDAQQRNALLAKIRRAALANRIVVRAGRSAGALRQVRTVQDHKIVKAFGTLPARSRQTKSAGD